MVKKTTVLFVLIMAMVIVLIFSLFKMKKKYSVLKESVAAIEANYLKKTGVDTSCLPNGPLEYHLRSFDAGEVWYACQVSNDSKIRIIGKAEEIYPGLVDCLLKKEIEIDSLLNETKK